MFSTIMLDNTSFTSLPFCCYCYNEIIYNFLLQQILSTQYSIIVTMLYITSVELIPVITGGLYLLIIKQSSPIPSQSAHSHCSTPCFSELACQVPHINEIILFLSFSVWLAYFIQHNALKYGSIHVDTNGRISSFSCLNNIPLACPLGIYDQIIL